MWEPGFDPLTNDADALMALMEWLSLYEKHQVQHLSMRQDWTYILLIDRSDKWAPKHFEAGQEEFRDAICTALEKWEEEKCD